jgi:hypothetical protein
MTTKTRLEMQDAYGSVPISIPSEPYTWTIHRASKSVSWTTRDGGMSWTLTRVVSGEQRAHNERVAHEQHRIQMELK